jgi:eukaryotic-like serine/threonine-protein kinase
MSSSARTSPEPPFARSLPDRYRLIRHLASGGMASVWCAEDRVLGRTVAIKVLSDRYAQDAQAVRRFKREARAVARVSAHPNVVTIFDVGDLEAGENGEHGDELHPGAFIVMEHLAGGTVADALRCDAVTREEARRWLGQAAEALDHAHARGIVHRDIKPANFLLDTDRGLHVADFGIAHLQSEETISSAGELFGTAAYLAPEQALGKEATSASDRYALAIAAFELLTGGRPYTAQHFAAQARQHIEEEPPRASEREPSLPPAVDAVLARGMAKDPKARYPTALAFVQALDAALDGDSTASTRVLTPAGAGRRAVASAVGGAALASAAAGAAPAAAAAGPAGAAGVAGPARSPRPASSGPPRRPIATPAAPISGSRRRPSRALPLIALGVVALGVGLVLTQLGSGGTAKRAAIVHHPPTRGTRHRPAAPGAKTTHSASASTSATTSTAAASSTTPAGSSSSGNSTSGSALQLQGHQELVNGNYTAAIPILERAVSASSPSDLSYAYALYDLGDALLRSGNAKAAIPVLEQRVKIPNQTATVQALLNQALRAVGQPVPPSNTGGAPVPPGHDHGHGQGKPGKGGD